MTTTAGSVRTYDPASTSGNRPIRRAAAYVRASTDRQQFSIENQLAVVGAYAHSIGASVVRVYSDGDQSGLNAQRRQAFLQLISDVATGVADFEVVLVHDVSRWGRFQNIDESGHYEFLCRANGVDVEYCADGFHNDQSMLSTLVKSVKRSMAAEYSRELSAKSLRGHLRMSRDGLFQGGTAEIGLRRLLIGADGQHKVILRPGERKAIQDDRVILVPGPMAERQAVQRAFRMYAFEGKSSRQIAEFLNQEGFRTTRGNPWKNQNVLHLLRCERYVGDFIYNRTSVKLQAARTKNVVSQHVRAKATIQPIVDSDLFAAAKARLDNAGSISDRHLLDHLTAVWCVNGYLSCSSMKAIPYTPVPNTYQDRFGSLAAAFGRLGYKQTRTYRYSIHSPLLRRLDRSVVGQVVGSVVSGAGTVKVDPGQLCVDNKVLVVAVLPYTKKTPGRPGWWLHYGRFDRGDLILLTRLVTTNDGILDHHLLPYPAFHGPSHRFTTSNCVDLARCRIGDLSEFYSRFLAITRSA